MDIEAMARAMFDEFHARFNRARTWLNHPDDDGLESGRNTFRAMAEAAMAVAPVAVEAVALFLPPDESVITEAVGDAKKSKK